MILIVDDYPDGAEAICKLLRHEGFPCKTASDGREGLAFIRAHPPEQPLLVLLDHMMPDLDGIEVLRQLRNDPAIARVPVIMFTAGFSASAREEAIALGIRAWFFKGEDPTMLVKAVGQEYELVGGVKQNADNRPSQAATEEGKARGA